MATESFEDIVEELADKIGVYGAGPENDEHPENCPCQICFTSDLQTRVERALLPDLRTDIAHKIFSKSGIKDGVLTVSVDEFWKIIKE